METLCTGNGLINQDGNKTFTCIGARLDVTLVVNNFQFSINVTLSQGKTKLKVYTLDYLYCKQIKFSTTIYPYGLVCVRESSVPV